MVHKFYKDSGGWFIDLPGYIESGLGTKGNLAMVAGADTMLDLLGGGEDSVTLRIETVPFDEAAGVLTKTGYCPYGRYYLFTGFGVSDHKLWLCPVTKYVFGGRYPRAIYVKVE